MREILFRGKNDAGEWLYGYLTKPAGNPCFIIDGDDYFGGVIKETIGQYTGLTDKNGTKIFEGDIVKGTIVSQWAKEEIICCVEYQTDGFVCIEKGEYKHKVKFAKNIEVIGNIHDNPKLLQGEEV